MEDKNNMVHKPLQADVVVVGGGTSGVIAAVAAARNGANTLLVERNEFLGGMLVSGLGLLGFRDRQGDKAIGGIAQELMDMLDETRDTQGHNYCPILNSLTPINTAMMQLRLMQLCHEAGVRLPGKEKVTYVKVTPEMVSRIVAEHIVNGRVVTEYTIGAAEGK